MRKDSTWHRATVVAINTLTPTTREIVIDAGPGAPAFTVGSHIDVNVMIEGHVDIRSYSLIGEWIAGAPYRIAVKAAPQSRGGSRYMWSLQPGSRLDISAPQNDFELDLSAPEYLLIAGGIGITPLVGMAQSLQRTNAPVRFLFGAASASEMAYHDALKTMLGERLEIFPFDQGRVINLDAEISKLHPQAELYVCGPIGMLDAVRKAWADAGRSRTKLRYETFGNSGRHAAQNFKVRVPSYAREIEVPGNISMLDALSAAGIEILSDCRRGECGVCAVGVIETQGEIDHRDVFFSDDEHISNQKICACVSRVAGGTITIDPGYRPAVVRRQQLRDN